MSRANATWLANYPSVFRDRSGRRWVCVSPVDPALSTAHLKLPPMVTWLVLSVVLFLAGAAHFAIQDQRLLCEDRRRRRDCGRRNDRGLRKIEAACRYACSGMLPGGGGGGLRRARTSWGLRPTRPGRAAGCVPSSRACFLADLGAYSRIAGPMRTRLIWRRLRTGGPLRREPVCPRG